MTRNFIARALGAAAFALLTVPALAGPPTNHPSPPVGGGAMRRPMDGQPDGSGSIAAELGLTAAQQQKIQALSTQMRAKVQALMSDGKPVDAAKRTKIQAMQSDFMTKFMGMLTPAQRAKVQARIKAMQNGAGKAGPGTPAESAPGHRP